MDLEILEKRLADETLYTDLERQAEMTTLVKQQARHKSDIEKLEHEWLELSEALDSAG